MALAYPRPLVLLLQLTGVAAADGRHPIEGFSLPPQAAGALGQPDSTRRYRVSFRANPYYFDGDSDGHGTRHGGVAVLVREIDTTKAAIAVIGESSVGRAAIEATARSFMEAFPDMVVTMESMRRGHGVATFHWLWTGTNTGPGGTGRPVRITGYEEWTFGKDGLIRESEGHYDEAEYQRQANGAGDGG